MALNFPNSPVDGQIYYDPGTNSKYVWVAASSKWKSMQYSSTIVAFGYQTANAAYDTTNAAFAMANAAYNVQNVDFTLSNSAFLTANLAFDSANSNWSVQNALYTVANTSYASINSNWAVTNALYSVANSAYAAANNVAPQIAPTYNTANAAFDVANASFAEVNAAYTTTNTAYASINSNWTVTNALYSVANSAFASANNVGPQIAPTYNTANAAYNQANAAYNGSNAGYTTANAAFAFANTRFSSSGGTISGAVEITADLTVHGNTRFIDQQTLQVGDPLIYLAANNYTSDVVDIGFVANYVNATSANVHTGLFRSSGSKEYYLFQGYDKEPINNYIDPVGNNITMAVLNATVRTSNLILGGTNTINWITSGYGVANAAFGVTNTSYASINSNWTVTNTVYGVANAAYGAANNVGPQIAPAYNTANAAFAKANNALPLAGGTLTGKPTISLDDASMAVAGSHLTINSPTLSQASLGFAFGGTGKASIRIDNGGSFVMNGAANTYYYGYDIVSGGAATSNFYTGSAYFMSAAGSAVTFPGSARSPIFYDSDNTGYYLDPASTTNISVLSMNSVIRRTDHAVGFLEGSYNNVGANDTKTNPIYTIGSSYNPTSTALSNMYGIGYTHPNFWSGKGGGWGLYVASAGTIKGTFGCESDPNTWISGYGLATGSWRAPLFYDSDNTGYYLDPASTTNLNACNVNGTFYSPGSVIQVKRTESTSVFSSSVNNTWVATGIQVSINPKFSSSKILVTIELATGQSTGGWATSWGVQRNGSVIGGGASLYGAFAGCWIATDAYQSECQLYGLSQSYLDSPATTSTCTYQIMYYGEGNTGYLNRCNNTGSGVNFATSISAITVMEIAQ